MSAGRRVPPAMRDGLPAPFSRSEAETIGTAPQAARREGARRPARPAAKPVRRPAAAALAPRGIADRDSDGHGACTAAPPVRRARARRSSEPWLPLRPSRAGRPPRPPNVRPPGPRPPSPPPPRPSTKPLVTSSGSARPAATQTAGRPAGPRIPAPGGPPRPIPRSGSCPRPASGAARPAGRAGPAAGARAPPPPQPQQRTATAALASPAVPRGRAPFPSGRPAPSGRVALTAPSAAADSVVVQVHPAPRSSGVGLGKPIRPRPVRASGRIRAPPARAGGGVAWVWRIGPPSCGASGSRPVQRCGPGRPGGPGGPPGGGPRGPAGCVPAWGIARPSTVRRRATANSCSPLGSEHTLRRHRCPRAWSVSSGLPPALPRAQAEPHAADVVLFLMQQARWSPPASRPMTYELFAAEIGPTPLVDPSRSVGELRAAVRGAVTDPAGAGRSR